MLLERNTFHQQHPSQLVFAPHSALSSDGKAYACNAGDLVQSLGQEEPLEKVMATHSSILAWKIPWMEEPGRLQSMGLQRVRHDWATSLLLWERLLLPNNLVSYSFTLGPKVGGRTVVQGKFLLPLPIIKLIFVVVSHCVLKSTLGKTEILQILPDLDICPGHPSLGFIPD